MQRAGRGPLGGRGARTRRVDATAAAAGTILVLVPLYHLGTNIIVVVTLDPTYIVFIISPLSGSRT